MRFIGLKYILSFFLVLSIVMLIGCGNNIHSAAYEGDLDTVKDWIERGEDVNAKHSISDGNILSYAVCSSNIDLVKFLITNGANINQLDANGTTPLHYASRMGSAEIVKLLCSKGANPNLFAPDYNRSSSQYSSDFPFEGTPLYWAIAEKKLKEEEKVKIVNALLANGVDLSGKYHGEQLIEPIVFAVNSRSISVTKMLLENGADVDPSRGCPLHEAVINNDLDMITLLLDNGANVNRKESYGSSYNLLGIVETKAISPKKVTPLQLAKSDEVKALLRQYGAKE